MFLAKAFASRYGWPSDQRSPETPMLDFALSVLSVCLICLLCFVSASLIARTLGRTGNAVLSRVLGMLRAAYSVQFVINGIAAVRASLS